jgi:hypothetical protein
MVYVYAYDSLEVKGSKGFSDLRGYIHKFPDWLDNEVTTTTTTTNISLRSNTKGYGGKTH